MNCPVCQSDTSVKDSRAMDGKTIRRRRVCDSGHRFNTWEVTADASGVIEAMRRVNPSDKRRAA